MVLKAEGACWTAVMQGIACQACRIPKGGPLSTSGSHVEAPLHVQSFLAEHPFQGVLCPLSSRLDAITAQDLCIERGIACMQA
jgi:hypothetical protein